MGQVCLIVISVLVMLLLERLLVSRATRSNAGREWVRNHTILHPNTISLVRIPMGAVGIGLCMMDWWSAGILWFSFWMISDLSDGTIARNCDLQTETGKWLDPLSDKCMYFPALAYLTFIEGPNGLPGGWVTTIIITDTVGQLARLVITKKAANYFGKAKTALITILLTLAALNQVHALVFLSPRLFYVLTVSCALLAFLSFYCKVIPDSWYANSLTLANFLCGIAAIWNISEDHPLRGFILVFVGQFFDLFDGRLARKYGSTRHGPLFDDFADGTSFGAAIGFLIWKHLDLGPATVPIVAIYVGCVVFRLYRFSNPRHDLPPGTFEGVPSPAGAMLAGSSVLLLVNWPLLGGTLVLLTSVLLISSVRYRHFGHRIWPNCPKSLKILSLLLFLLYVNFSIADKNYAFSFTLFCFAMACLYVLVGIDRPETAPAEPSGTDPEVLPDEP